MNDSEIVTIQSLAYGGDGVGRLDSGQVCFVPGALPGERVEVKIARDKGSFSRGILLRILNASPERIEPACPLFRRAGDNGNSCPGCVYQDLVYKAEVEWKSRQLQDFLFRSKLADETVMEQPTASPRRYNTRNKVKLNFRQGEFGYIGQDNQSLLPLKKCILLNEKLNSALPPSVSCRNSVTMRYTQHDGITAFADAGVSAKEGWLTEELPGIGEFKVPRDGFFQTNIEVAAELVRRAVAMIADSGADELLELYCGVGVFSIAAAKSIPDLKCTGVELNNRAIKAARFNADKHSVDRRCRFICEDAGNALQTLHSKGNSSVILLDPPRSGLSKNALDQVISADAETVIYVSCAADTLRRDLEKFCKSGYRIASAGIFDMFPATAHFETLILLKKRESENR